MAPGGQGTGQVVRADEGEAGALAGQERGCVRGVAQQRDPAAGPAGHADLADRVEEHVVRVAEGGQDAGDLPAGVGEDVGDQVALGLLVPEQLARRGGLGEVHEGVHLVVVLHGVEGGGPARGVPDDRLVGEAEGVAHGEHREAVTEVAVEALLGAEHHPPGARVHAVRAEDQVERTASAAPEDDVDPVPGLVEGVDRVVEQELHVVPDRRVQSVREVPAPYLQVAAGGTAGDGVRVE